MISNPSIFDRSGSGFTISLHPGAHSRHLNCKSTRGGCGAGAGAGAGGGADGGGGGGGGGGCGGGRRHRCRIVVVVVVMLGLVRVVLLV